MPRGGSGVGELLHRGDRVGGGGVAMVVAPEVAAAAAGFVLPRPLWLLVVRAGTTQGKVIQSHHGSATGCTRN